MKTFKLALIQMHVEGGDKATNLKHAQDLIQQASRNGAQVLLLPEAMNLGWTHPSAKLDADEIPQSSTCQMLMNSALKNNVYICCGIIENEGKHAFNSAILISPQGKVILHHRKLNELDIAHEFYEQGNRLNVCSTEFGTFGLMICSDAFADSKVLSQALCYMGADVILSPSSWAVPKEHDNEKEPVARIWQGHYQSVAEKFSVWIAGVSNVGKLKTGPWKGMNCIGNSLVINNQGEIAAQGPFGVDAETIIYADIAPVPRPARGSGWANYIGTLNK